MPWNWATPVDSSQSLSGFSLITSYDSEFQGQEYIGIHPTIDKFASLPGRIDLGLENIHPTMQKRDLSRRSHEGSGVYLIRLSLTLLITATGHTRARADLRCRSIS